MIKKITWPAVVLLYVFLRCAPVSGTAAISSQSINKIIRKILASITGISVLLLLGIHATGQPEFKFVETFSANQPMYTKTGRGSCTLADGVLKVKDAYAGFGKQEWINYEIKFRARTPLTEKEVQVWAGFRENNRDDRYIIGFRGGMQNNLYLSRLGYMGTDEFLALRPLDFAPKPGMWYNFRIEVCGDRIRVFINDETLPRIDIKDKNSRLAPSGKITLGGGWITTDYDDLSVTNLPVIQRHCKNY
jgi:beta-galactosidase